MYRPESQSRVRFELLVVLLCLLVMVGSIVGMLFVRHATNFCPNHPSNDNPIVRVICAR